MLDEVLRDGLPETRAIVLPPARAGAKLEAGVPLLHGEAVGLDVGFARRTFGRLVDLSRSCPETAEPSARLAAEVGRHRIHVEQVVEEAFVNHADHLEALAVHA